MEIVEPIRDKELIQRVKNILAESGTRNLLLGVLGFNSGLRISDMLPLKVSQVRNQTHIEIKEKKTGKRKKFPINPTVRAVLNPYIEGKPDDEYLFKSRQGTGHITRQQAYEIIHNACEKAGIKDKVGTHTLRKSFGYFHYLQNHDVAWLQQILNHSSPSITLRYIGINQDLIDESYNSFSL